MDKNQIRVRKLQLDDLIHVDEETQVEYWLARELMQVLGYERWEIRVKIHFTTDMNRGES